MDNIKNIILGIAVTLALVSGGILFKTIDKVETIDSLGALSSPNIQSPYLSFGGVRQWARSTGSLTQATTTVCAIQSPVSTSTLVMGSIQLSVSSTTATTVTLAKAATAYATTTALGSASVGANGRATVISERTAAGGDALDETFGPSEWFVVGMAGNVGTFSPTGTCKAVWIEN